MTIQTDDILPAPPKRVVSAAPVSPQEEAIELTWQSDGRPDRRLANVDTCSDADIALKSQVLELRRF